MNPAHSVRRAAHSRSRAESLAGALIALFAVFVLTAPAFAAPKFPALTGRVVDEAGVLSPATEASLTDKLAALEERTHRQLVVVTIRSLDDYPIDDYGYQLGRTWGIGRAGKNDGALFIVAPNDRKVRVEVGYGLEPILTDALSSVILQRAVLPKFRTGDIEGGVVAGTDAIIEQLSLDAPQAQARVAAAAQPPARKGSPLGGIITIIIVFFILSAVFRGGGRRGGMGWLLPLLIMSSSSSSRRGGGWGGGGSWGGGGGGFSGGGGSFGGGGASGSW